MHPVVVSILVQYYWTTLVPYRVVKAVPPVYCSHITHLSRAEKTKKKRHGDEEDRGQQAPEGDVETVYYSF